MGVKDSANAIYRVEPEFAHAHEDEVPRGYKRTEVGVIPEDWSVVNFQDVIGSFIDYRGRTPRKLGMEWGGGEILALSANNVQMGRIAPEKEANYGSEDLYRKWMLRGDCEKGDVLVTTEAPLGNVAQIPDTKKYILSQRVLLIKPRECLQRDYLFHLMTGDQFQAQLLVNASGTTATGIQRARLELVPIPIPEGMAEQEAIAEVLGDADALIESLQQLVAKKRAIKQDAMQALLTGRLRLPGFTDEWQTKRLENLGAFRKGQGVSRGDSQSGSLPCVRYGEIYTTHNNFIRTFASWISEAVAKSATRINEGDILFAGSGETKAEIGKCVVVNQDIVAYAGGDIVIFHLYEGDPLFYGYALNTPDVNRQKASRGQGDAVVHISSAALATIEVAVPGVEEQTAIATVLSDMDAEIEALEARLAKTGALKAGMMQALLTGRIRLV